MGKVTRFAGSEILGDQRACHVMEQHQDTLVDEGRTETHCKSQVGNRALSLERTLAAILPPTPMLRSDVIGYHAKLVRPEGFGTW